MGHPRLVDCARCARGYVLPRWGSWLAVCPHCSARFGGGGAGGGGGFRSNANAAVMAVMAAGLLSVALVSPFIRTSQFGVTRTYSLAGAVRELLASGHVMLAALVGVTSIVLPYVKLVMILMASTSLASFAEGTRGRLAWWASFAGKYSVLELLLVAIAVTIFRFGAVVNASGAYGNWVFLGAVVASMLAGACVRVGGAAGGHHE